MRIATNRKDTMRKKLIEILQKTAAEGISADNDLAGKIPP
jgi:hypothetical protein